MKPHEALAGGWDRSDGVIDHLLDAPYGALWRKLMTRDYSHCVMP